jgi:hypothetical protein
MYLIKIIHNNYCYLELKFSYLDFHFICNNFLDKLFLINLDFYLNYYHRVKYELNFSKILINYIQKLERISNELIN